MSSSSYRVSRHDRAYRNSSSGKRYHSPSSSSRVSSSRYDGDRENSSSRGRDRERDRDRYGSSATLDDYRTGTSGGSACAGKCFSSFYRERFGSHSPEDYRNLRISQFNRALSKNEIRLLLEREFKSTAPFEIKIVRNPEDDERLAYVNFERDNCAKTIRRSLIPRLRHVLGERLVLDPIGDQEGKCIPDRKNDSMMAEERPTPPLPTRTGRRRPRSRSASPRYSSGRVALPPQSQSSHRENPSNNFIQDENDMDKLGHLSEKRLRESNSIKLPDSDDFFFAAEKERYFRNMYKLIVTARQEIQSLEAKLEQTTKTSTIKQPTKWNNKETKVFRLQSRCAVTCPSCSTKFSTDTNRFLPKYLKVLRSTNRVELQFNDMDHLKEWLVMNNLDRDAEGVPTYFDVKNNNNANNVKLVDVNSKICDKKAVL